MSSSRTIVLAVAALTFVVGSCSDESSTGSTSTSAPTTAPAVTTSSSSSTTSTTSSTSTSTSSTSTTSTIPAVEGLELSATGLGDALFGAEAEGVIAYVESIVGAPTSDTGWTDPMAIGAACPGTEVRFVSWADLSLFFTNDSLAASGLRHFASYTYGPAFGPVIDPYGLTTDEGIGVGAEVSQLEATFPGGVLSVGDEIFGPSFLIEEGLFVFLSDAGPTGIAVSFMGGYGCGE